MKKITAVLLLLIILPVFSGAREIYQTTADAVRTAEYVAHVQVEGSYYADGSMRGFQDYTVYVAENIKGRLPELVMLRIIKQPGSKVYESGSQLIVILGEKNSEGIYPLVSFYWGVIPLYLPEGGEELALARPVTGFGKTQRYSLADFTGLVKKIR